jgi:Uma2 family endonuclease
VKFAVQASLLAGIRRAALQCHMLPDGMSVRIDRDTAHEPDALVYCGKKLPPRAIEVREPTIVVEVLSPSTRYVDASAKLAGYFSLPSVHHYLIVEPEKPLVVHHARAVGEALTTRVLHAGPLSLDPPGIDLLIEDFYPPLD